MIFEIAVGIFILFMVLAALFGRGADYRDRRPTYTNAYKYKKDDE